MRSSLAADVHAEDGCKNVAHLEMGFDAWKAGDGAWEEVAVPGKLR
jgi:rhodanese-related sulfurtransferase